MTRKQHARRIVQALSADHRAALRLEPRTAMVGTGITVRAVSSLTSSRGAGGMCDGMSFFRHGTVLYAPTESRRENFTLLHEYAHLLITNDAKALTWVANQNEPAFVLERLCDDIASALLVPDDVLDQIVGEGPITGQHLLDLFQKNPAASQVVCAIALASRLTCVGTILLTDRTTHKVVHASAVGEPNVYPAKEQAVPTGHPLRYITPGRQLCKESFWATPWGDRQTYYLNATATEKRTYSVLADIDLWNTTQLHLPSGEATSETRPSLEVACRCGFTGTTRTYACDDCQKPFCPKCQACDCTRRAALTQRCIRCFVTVAKKDIEEGLCSNCR